MCRLFFVRGKSRAAANRVGAVLTFKKNAWSTGYLQIIIFANDAFADFLKISDCQAFVFKF
ncbi:MAG: hypothetical protein IT259_06150 [Saprospiraceae bacterium]|nr:hypothetical protein [Saprospiraceae bacterium]